MQTSPLSSQFNAQPKHTRGGETTETSKTPSAQPERTSQRLIQSIYKGGGRRLTQPNHTTTETAIHSTFQSLYKGAIDTQSTKTDGNVYNPKSSFPKDAKRKHNGTSKKARPKTRITRLLA
jgi:hypothetical protein